MTQDQENQFTSYGCGSRCLIALANKHGNPITRAEFIDRFSSKYPEWQTRCGATGTSSIFEIAKELGICNYLQTYIGKDKVRNILNEEKTKPSELILVTERWPIGEGGKLKEFYHCQLVMGGRQTEDGNTWVWEIAEVAQCMVPMPSVLMTDAQIDLLGGYFLVLT